MSNKGIVNYSWSYKSEDESAWHTAATSTLSINIAKKVNYSIILKVQDVEGSWSELDRKEIYIENELPLTLTSSVEPVLNNFSINSIPATESVRINATVKYHKAVNLSLAVYNSSNQLLNQLPIKSSGTFAQSSGGNIVFNPILYQIPSTYRDGNYYFKVVASDSSNLTIKDENRLDIGVNTPIDLRPDAITKKMSTGENFQSYASTSKYVTTITLKVRAPGFTTQNIGVRKINGKWTSSTITTPNLANDGTIDLEYTATTPSGKSETKHVYVQVEAFAVLEADFLPVDPMAGDKLYFRVHTKGYAEKLELVLEPNVISEDKRIEMGYRGVEYKGNSVWMDIDKSVYEKTNTLEYIIWCTTSQSQSLKQVRYRQPYRFKIRAWKGNRYIEKEFVRDITGDVRQLLKITIKK